MNQTSYRFLSISIDVSRFGVALHGLQSICMELQCLSGLMRIEIDRNRPELDKKSTLGDARSMEIHENRPKTKQRETDEDVPSIDTISDLPDRPRHDVRDSGFALADTSPCIVEYECMS